MGTTTPVSVAEYLSTSYRPDCEYVDGEIQERNVGEYDHARLQRELIVYLHSRRKQWNIHVVPEQRVQIGPTRYRVPDICVVCGPEPQEQILTHPPFLCIEILSPEDRMGKMQERIDDYLRFGVRYVWIFNPQTQRAYCHTADGMQEAKDAILRTNNPEIVVPLAEIFKPE